MFDFQPGKYKNTISSLWRLFKWSLIGGLVFLLAVNFNLFWLFGGKPGLKELDNPSSNMASEIISADGKLLGKYYVENRSPVEYNEISPNVIKALIAVEDSRYLQHSGIDLKSWGRVIAKLGKAGGGSTLSQQLAKNLFKIREDEDYSGPLTKVPFLGKLIIKIKEWIIAVKLERRYTKKEIITMYLNTVDFSSLALGIKSAARTYFDKTPAQLNIPESAILMGMVQSPTRFNPKINPERSINRRNIVLSQMHKYGYISLDQFEKYKLQPANLKYGLESHNTGLAAYFRGFLRVQLQKWLKENGLKNSDLNTGGYKIYTTVDARMQAYAEEAMRTHMKEQQAKFDSRWAGRNPWVYLDGSTFKEIPNFMTDAVKRSYKYQQLKKEGFSEDEAMTVMRRPVKTKIFSWRGEKDTLISPINEIKYYKRFLNLGMLSMDPRDGAIKAWVGGVNYKYFNFDHVQQSQRQPGSTFKPFLYATAVENGFSTCATIIDQPVTFGTEDGLMAPYTPKNSDGKWSGSAYTLRRALGESINSISAFLIKLYKPESVIAMAKRLGITSKLDPVPSLCLGVSDVSVYEMVRAYSTFANGGKLCEPYFITRIEDRYGNLLQEFKPDTKEVISEDLAYKMIHLMKGATSSGGTSVGLSRYGVLSNNEVAAKTGTTSNYSDGWFMGSTPHLVTGVWVGGDDRAIHFRSLADGQGARVAMPAWGLYMQKVYANTDLSKEYGRGFFKKPASLIINGDCILGQDESGAPIIDSSNYAPNATKPAAKPKVDDETL